MAAACSVRNHHYFLRRGSVRDFEYVWRIAGRLVKNQEVVGCEFFKKTNDILLPQENPAVYEVDDGEVFQVEMDDCYCGQIKMKAFCGRILT